MAEFLRRYGPCVDTRNVKSELDILREIPSYEKYVNNGMQFNYHFTEDSYALYSRIQNRTRLELTQFRMELSRRLEKRGKRLRINGYLYNLADAQDPYYRPEGYNHRGHAGPEGRRDRRDNLDRRDRDRRDDFDRRDRERRGEFDRRDRERRDRDRHDNFDRRGDGRGENRGGRDRREPWRQ